MTRRAVASRVGGSAVRQSFLLFQKLRGGDEGNVGEGLRKIAEQSFFARIVFFRKQTKIVLQREQALEKFVRFFFAPEPIQANGKPE